MRINQSIPETFDGRIIVKIGNSEYGEIYSLVLWNSILNYELYNSENSNSNLYTKTYKNSFLVGENEKLLFFYDIIFNYIQNKLLSFTSYGYYIGFLSLNLSKKDYEKIKNKEIEDLDLIIFLPKEKEDFYKVNIKFKILEVKNRIFNNLEYTSKSHVTTLIITEDNFIDLFYNTYIKEAYYEITNNTVYNILKTYIPNLKYLHSNITLNDTLLSDRNLYYIYHNITLHNLISKLLVESYVYNNVMNNNNVIPILFSSFQPVFKTRTYILSDLLNYAQAPLSSVTQDYFVGNLMETDSFPETFDDLKFNVVSEDLGGFFGVFSETFNIFPENIYTYDFITPKDLTFLFFVTRKGLFAFFPGSFGSILSISRKKIFRVFNLEQLVHIFRFNTNVRSVEDTTFNNYVMKIYNFSYVFKEEDINL